METGNQHRTAPKRKRENPHARRPAPSTAFSRRSPPRQSNDDPENDDGDRSPPRKLKRPGGGSRIAAANREAAELERKQREEESQRLVAEQRKVPGADIIAQHYNAVPERGRDWRQTESKIAGLRSLNNWIKSTLIQKFSRPEIPVRDLRVVDLACGKGGDLGKWKKAPQVPVLYVGCDIADVSIEQAKGRYEEDLRKMRGRPRMEAEFYVHDTFAKPLNEIMTIRNVGFNPHVGPSNGVIQGPGMMGGFDVVSMMFALHYSFENETLARGMLSNVAGLLKKGGRFIGVMPNSDVISNFIKPHVKAVPPKHETKGEDKDSDEDDWDPEKPADDWDPEQPADDDWDPEKPAETEPAEVKKPTEDLTFGNDLYSVRIPPSSIPADGVFRPPFGWKYHYHLEEAVEAPEYVVPWEAFRALAEDYGLELMYRKGFKEVFEDESVDQELGELAYRMKVMSRNPREGLLVKPEEMEAAAFYHAFCFYKT